MSWMAQWILKKQDERFLQALIDTKAELDEVSDRQVQRVLLFMRWQRAAAPYLYIFKLAWEFVRGRYWFAYQKVRRSANQTSGGGAGAAGQPVAQFTGYGSGFASSGPATGGAGGVGSFGGVSMPPPNLSPVFEDAGIRSGEVVAYRCWRLCPDGKLYSMYQSTYCWEPGQTAEGDVVSGDGIHAFKSVLLMAQYGEDYGSSYPIVTGTVELWGEIYEHERGYRASRAAIKSIDDSHEYDAAALRKLYGLPKKKVRKTKS